MSDVNALIETICKRLSPSVHDRQRASWARDMDALGVEGAVVEIAAVDVAGVGNMVAEHA